MRPAPGDIVYAFKRTKPPSRRRTGFRMGIRWPVLRVTPWSVTDGDGNDWICVLPVRHGVWETRLNPHKTRWIPLDDVGEYKESLRPEVLEVVSVILNGEDPRYPWIEPVPDENGPTTPPRPEEDYPTIGEAVEGRQRPRP